MMSWTGKICILMQGNAEGGEGGIPSFILMYNVIPGTASLARNVERTH